MPPERPLERRRARAVWRVAQAMFAYTAFNGPVEAWDVGQVTRMDVRRRLFSGVGGGVAGRDVPGASCAQLIWGHV